MKSSGSAETKPYSWADVSDSAWYLSTALNSHTPVAVIGQSNFIDMVYPSSIEVT